MKRSYSSGEETDITFFVGKEVEHTPAYGLTTLFICGLQDQEIIQNVIKKNNKSSSDQIEHLFFGANHSFNPKDEDEIMSWEYMIQYFLEEGYLCSLDIPFKEVETFNQGLLCDYENFIPQIRIPVPNIRQWNYNTMVKIDDIDFKASNPGIWTHSLHKLMDQSVFTDWRKYKKDTIIK